MPQKRLRILILNWRDIKNPASGGAEVLTHEMAKRWVAWGHEVTQFSSLFNGSVPGEMIDGAKIIRKGNPDARHFINSVHFKAFLHYQKHFKGRFDIVVDEIHGLPFFTPLYVKERKVALICEVAGKIWDTNFPFPFNILGKLVEKNYFKFYKNIDFLTISDSTKKELIRFGISDKKITVLPMGITKPKSPPKFNKEKNPTLIFVARLLKAKGIESAIEVCSKLKDDFPNIKLWVIGRGEKNYETQLRRRVKELNLSKHVLFLGYLSQSEKFEKMQKAHLLIAPSLKEGFGLTVPEAGIVGTPAIVYNVEGFRDIIKNMENGILVDIDPNEMAFQAKRILRDKKLYKKLQEGAASFARSLNWDKTAKVALSVV